MFRFKMAAEKRISFRENSHMTKIGKNTFPYKVFNKIWLKVEEHEYFQNRI